MFDVKELSKEVRELKERMHSLETALMHKADACQGLVQELRSLTTELIALRQKKEGFP